MSGSVVLRRKPANKEEAVPEGAASLPSIDGDGEIAEVAGICIDMRVHLHGHERIPGGRKVQALHLSEDVCVGIVFRGIVCEVVDKQFSREVFANSLIDWQIIFFCIAGRHHQSPGKSIVAKYFGCDIVMRNQHAGFDDGHMLHPLPQNLINQGILQEVPLTGVRQKEHSFAGCDLPFGSLSVHLAEPLLDSMMLMDQCLFPGDLLFKRLDSVVHLFKGDMLPL